MKYILDTNTFWDVLKKWNSSNTSVLLPKLEENGVLEFGLSEISAMEIHSVLGNCIRRKPQRQKCDRQIETENGIIQCPHTWTTKRFNLFINKSEAQSLIRLINDILKQRHTSFNVKIIPLNEEIIEHGSNLLQKYAYRFDFHSLDALIGATAIKSSATLITFDKALKNVLTEEGVIVE